MEVGEASNGAIFEGDLMMKKIEVVAAIIIRITVILPHSVDMEILKECGSSLEVK